MVAGAISTIAGLAICLFVMLKNEFLPSHFVHGELDVRTIGHAPVSYTHLDVYKRQAQY